MTKDFVWDRVPASVIGLVLCFSPLLGIHGVESALVLGMLMPPFVAGASAHRAAMARRRHLGFGTRHRIGRALGNAIVTIAIPLTLLALNSLRVRQCAPWEGLAFELLGPVVGVSLAAVVGTACATLPLRPWAAVTLATLTPIAAIMLGVYRFWSSPAIFSYAHFAGFFPGTIYDEDLSISTTYLTFRLTSALLFVALLLGFHAVVNPASGRASWRRMLLRPRVALAAAGSLVVVLVADAFGPELGHRSSASWIAERLGATEMSPRCVVHAPRELELAERQRLASDCDYRVFAAETALGVRQQERVTAYFFRSADEKRELMGAARTFIAKPWRNEVYLQVRPWPHPVLAHEIAHVVARGASRGPFMVSGRWGGWLPNPGLIEGLAVAVAWSERDELTPHQWAAAMLALDRLPSFDQLFGLSFLGQPSQNAYTAAGSFVAFLLETRGPDALRRAYAAGDLEATGEQPAELETEWRRYLHALSLPEGAVELARARFAGRSIFTATCPHELARLRSELSGELAAGDVTAAVHRCRDILEIDAGDDSTRSAYVNALFRAEQDRDAQAQLARLASAPPPLLLAAKESQADELWRRGEVEQALEIYRGLAHEPRPEDEARVLEVKSLALETGDRVAELVFDLLVGENGNAASPSLAVHLARELRREGWDAMGAYLEARQLVNGREHDRAASLLREALQIGLPTRRLRVEARRLLGEALFASRDWTESAGIWEQIRADADSSEASRATAHDWLDRIAWTRRQTPG